MKFEIQIPNSKLRTSNFELRTGFTIIELLVVISIILLLTGILMPSIVLAKNLGHLAATRAYITTLETGALRYQQERQYFPGQEDPSLMAVSSSRNQYTGGQILVSELMGIERTGDGEYPDPEDVNPTSEYVNYDTDHVTTVIDAYDDDREYTPVDSFPRDDACALLYYPSRLGNNGTLYYGTNPPYQYTDNQSYTKADFQPIFNFIGIVWDTRFSEGGDYPFKTTWGTNIANTGDEDNKAYNSDTFLIFGKSLKNRDQEYSWFTPQSPKNYTYQSPTEK